MQAIFWILGLMNLANGLWMLLAPEAWYHDLPAGVPDTGPLNLHFVRDIGAAFTTIGIAFLAAAVRPSHRRGVLLAATVFYVLHALVHVTDLASGRLHAEHWLIDLPGVFLPAVLLVVLSLPRWWKKVA
jgi:predicted anti-sigma-YlaC factor YlaD